MFLVILGYYEVLNTKCGNAFPNVYSFIIHYKNCIID